MAISSAFKSAATEKVGQQNKLMQGFGGAAMGMAAGAVALSNPTGIANMAGRITGVGGSVMASTLQEKTETARINAEKKALFSAEEIKTAIGDELGGNPINNAAIKQLGTVFEVLQREKMNKGKQINIQKELGGNEDDTDR